MWRPFKLLLILATYGLLTWILSPYGKLGWIATAISGTCFAGMISLARRQDIVPLARVITYTLFGVFIGVTCLGHMLMPRKSWQGTAELAMLEGMILGGLWGGVIGMFINAFHRLPPIGTSSPKPAAPPREPRANPN
jgi:hypothetical protein